MFDGFDGHYLGDFVDPALANALMSFPFNAVQGPDAKIYLADSGNESVHRFTQHGLDDGVFADMSDVLGDAHGIAFFESMVYVASGGSAKVIAVFDENGERQPDYLSSGINPYDLFFFDDGRMALSDIDGDAVKLYAPGGGSHVTLTATGFPEQLAHVDGDTILVAEFIGDEVFELSTSGQRGRSADADNPRGVAPLENGHWLVTSSDGVLVIDPDAATIVDIHFGGDGGWRFIEPAWLPADLF
jgi:DNA-binding beta-propeller fold protein YncE